MRHLALLALLLTSCMPPTFEERELPPTPEVALALACTDAACEEIAWPSESWWQEFRDEQLSQLIDLALKQNPKLSERAYKIIEALAAIDFAEAQNLPQVWVQPSGAWSKIAPLGPEGEFLRLGDKTTGFLKQILIQTQWMLDIWGQVSTRMAAAQAFVEQQQAEWALTRLLLSAQTSRAYVSWQAAQQRRLLLVRAQEAAATIAELQHIRRENSLEPVQVVAAARQTAAEYQQAVIGVTLQTEELTHLLQQVVADLSGALPELELRTLGEMLPAQSLVPNNLPLELVGHRPDLIAARWSVETAARVVKVSRTAWYPNLNLLAGEIGLQAIEVGSLLSPEALMMGVGPALNLPWFDGGSRNATYTAALNAYYAAVEAYHAALLKASEEVLNAVSALRAAERNLQQARLVRADMHEQFRMAEQLFKSNLFNVMQLEQARLAMLEIEIAYLNAEELLLVAAIDLQTNLGGGYHYTAD